MVYSLHQYNQNNHETIHHYRLSYVMIIMEVYSGVKLGISRERHFKSALGDKNISKFDLAVMKTRYSTAGNNPTFRNHNIFTFPYLFPQESVQGKTLSVEHFPFFSRTLLRSPFSHLRTSCNNVLPAFPGLFLSRQIIRRDYFLGTRTRAQGERRYSDIYSSLKHASSGPLGGLLSTRT